MLGGGDPASLDGPLAIATTPSGDVVVADKAKDSVREFTAAGQLVREIGTPGSYINLDGLAVDASSGEIWVSDNMGTHGFTADGTPEATAVGNGVGPYQTDGVAVSPTGTLYVFNGATDVIYEYSSTGTILAMWPAANVVPVGASPTTLAVDAQGNVYIAGVGYDEIRKFDSAGTEVATLWPGSVTSLAISGSTLYAQLDSGPGAEIATYDLSGNRQGQFTDSNLAAAGPGPTFTVGAAGINAITSDHTIEQLGLDGTPKGSWGGLANDDFQAAYALEDSAGDIYISDAPNDRIIRYDAQGDPPTVFADLSAYGEPGYAWFDSQGDLLVEAGSYLVTLGSDGSVLSAATGGSGSIPFSPPGAWYTATDSAGNVYADGFHGMADVPSSDIGKYSPAGQLLATINVSAAWGFGIPGPLAVDGQGRIYVATNTNDIREFAPDGTLIAVWPTSAPASSLSVAANGDVYATTGATVTRFSDFLDPLPPVPAASESPFDQSMEASIGLILASPNYPRGSLSGSLSTTLQCTGSAGVSCVGTLSLSAKVRSRKGHSKRTTTRSTLLGSKAFSIPAGQRTSATVKLNAAARQLLSTRATLDATLTASYRAGANSSTFTRKVVLHGHAGKRKPLKRRAGKA